MKTHGQIWLDAPAKRYIISTAPHVARRIRALFNVSRQFGNIHIPATPANVEDLEWILSRYPMKADEETRENIARAAKHHRDSLARADEIVSSPNALPISFELELPLRDYQRSFVGLAQLRKRILLGDDLGLGKTAQAIGLLAFARSRPAIVVCQAHLQGQWQSELALFAPLMTTHIIASTKAHDYRLPEADVYIITYAKLASWAERFSSIAKAIVFDEAQELRRPESQKYVAAKHISARCTYAIGLSATPVYNYGDEVFAVIDCLFQGALGSRNEFLGEWTDRNAARPKVKDPVALGAYLREQHLFLRRTRKDVGRELPATNRIVQLVSYESKILDDMKSDTLFLARKVIEGTFTEQGQAARQLDLKLRQATGIAKAKSVAEFIVEIGEKVVVAAWHREVYNLLQHYLDQQAFPSWLYTGSESPQQKAASVNSFVEHDGPGAFLMSTRSGVGLNGLQNVCNVVVFAELDWTDQVHKQIIGRLRRDGQENQVTAFFLIAEAGSDPVISDLLNLKTIQSEGIADLRHADEIPSEVGAISGGTDDNTSRIKRLAAEYIRRSA